jgi:hypothetical protein
VADEDVYSSCFNYTRTLQIRPLSETGTSPPVRSFRRTRLDIGIYPRVFIGKVMEEQMKRFAATSASFAKLGASKPEPLLQEEWVAVLSEDLSHEPPL